EVGGGERVVDGDGHAARVGDLDQPRDVEDAEERVRRRLDPEQLRLGPEGGLDGVGVGEVEEGEGEAERLEHLRHEAEGAAVEVVRRDDVVAGAERLEEGVGGGDAGGEGDAVGGPLERGEVALEGRPRGVRDAGVLVAVVDAGGLLDVRAREVDRRHDGAGGGVRVLAGVDGARAEAGPAGGRAVLGGRIGGAGGGAGGGHGAVEGRGWRGRRGGGRGGREGFRR